MLEHECLPLAFALRGRYDGRPAAPRDAGARCIFDAMPIVPFETLPDESRVWVFGSDRALAGRDAERLLAEVDRFLSQWKAHGVPLTCARDWRDEHLLTVGVDSTREDASGCSIDGLFRVLQTIERPLGTRLVGGGRLLSRDTAAHLRAV